MKKFVVTIIAAVCALSVLSCSKDSASSIKITDSRVINGMMTMTVGTVTTIEVSVVPASAASALTWTSSNSSVVMASAGYVSAIAPGTAEITVSSANGKKASFTAVVSQLEITDWTMSPSSLEIAPGYSNYVEFNILSGEGMNEDNKDIYTAGSLNFRIEGENSAMFSYSISGNTVAVSCSESAPSDGSCTAVLVSSNKSGTVQKQVTLTAIYREVTSVSLNKTSISELMTSSKTELQASISPSNATAKDIEWSASNDCVTLEPDGMKCIVHGAKAGSVTVTATAVSNSSAKASCSIKVVEPYVKSINVYMDQTIMCVGSDSTRNIVVIVNPSEFPYTVENLTPNLIDLDGNTLSNPKAKGIATVRVKADDYTTEKSVLIIDKDYSLSAFHGSEISDLEKASCGFYNVSGCSTLTCLPNCAFSFDLAVDGYYIDYDSWCVLVATYGNGKTMKDFATVTQSGDFTTYQDSDNFPYYVFKAPSTISGAGMAKISFADGKSLSVSLTSHLSSATIMAGPTRGCYSNDFKLYGTTVQNGGSYSVTRPSSSSSTTYLKVALNTGQSYNFVTSLETTLTGNLNVIAEDTTNMPFEGSTGSRSFAVKSSTPKGTYKIYCVEVPDFYFNVVVK